MYGNIEALKASPKCQEKFPGRFSMADTLWTCPKSHIDGQNHKNTCFRRAIFHKCTSRRARPSIDGPIGNTGDFVPTSLTHPPPTPSFPERWDSQKGNLPFLAFRFGDQNIEFGQNFGIWSKIWILVVGPKRFPSLRPLYVWSVASRVYQNIKNFSEFHSNLIYVVVCF